MIFLFWGCNFLQKAEIFCFLIYGYFGKRPWQCYWDSKSVIEEGKKVRANSIVMVSAIVILSHATACLLCVPVELQPAFSFLFLLPVQRERCWEGNVCSAPGRWEDWDWAVLLFILLSRDSTSGLYQWVLGKAELLCRSELSGLEGKRNVLGLLGAAATSKEFQSSFMWGKALDPGNPLSSWAGDEGQHTVAVVSSHYGTAFYFLAQTVVTAGEILWGTLEFVTRSSCSDLWIAGTLQNSVSMAMCSASVLICTRAHNWVSILLVPAVLCRYGSFLAQVRAGFSSAFPQCSFTDCNGDPAYFRKRCQVMPSPKFWFVSVQFYMFGSGICAQLTLCWLFNVSELLLVFTGVCFIA